MSRKREKKVWSDPVKDQAPAPETLAIEGDWNKFTEDMRRLFSKPKTEEGKPTSAFPGPAVSS
jgi:hypothetical protein